MILKQSMTFILASIFTLGACTPTKQTSDANVRNSGDASGSEAEDKDGDFTEPAEVDVFAEHAARYEEAFKAYASACIANTQIAGNEDIKFYTGFDGVNTYSNFTYVQLFCDGGSTETLAELDQALFQMDPVRFEELYIKLVAETGLGEHFQAAVEKASATGSAGITISDTFWAAEAGNSFFVATYDATAATVDTPETITFSYEDQSLVSDINIYEYTAQQVTDGTAIYTASCAGCHTSENGADHSPLTIGTCSDIEIAGAINNSAYAEDLDNPNSVCAQNRALAVAHAQGLDEVQTAAVTAYLRTLPLPFQMDAEQAGN